MSDLLFYPKHPPTVGTVLLSCYKLMYHVNEIPRARVPDAIEKSKDIFDGAKGDLEMIRGWLALQLSDAPIEPLLGADENRKGSVLGLVSLACALHDEDRGDEVKEALESGEAIIVYRLSGEIEKTTRQIEIFPNYKTLLRHVQDSDFYEGDMR